MRKIHASVIFVTYIRVHFCSLGAAAGNELTWQKKMPRGPVNRAADHYDEFYLWQTIKLAGNGSRLRLHACARVLTIAS